jgi:hypothetical protein
MTANGLEIMQKRTIETIIQTKAISPKTEASEVATSTSLM